MMSVGVSFGSIGDLIAVGELAWLLAKALSDSRGSAREYQGLVKELENFNKALLQVVALWQNYEASLELDELGKIARDGIQEWRDMLCTFQTKYEKRYGRSLGPTGSGNWIKDGSKKVLWLKEKEEVAELRRQIRNASDMVTLFVLAAMGKSNKLDHSTQMFRIRAVHSLLQESVKLANEQVSRLKDLGNKMDSQAHTSKLILSQVTNGVTSLALVKSTVIDIKGVLDMIKAQIIWEQAAPRGLGGHWQQAPVTLEDALGNIVPIPLELVNSWDMFETILAKRFEKLPGEAKVRRKQYVIEDSRSGRDFSSQREWSMCFRPGQKVAMSMVFKELGNSTSCPGCQKESTSINETFLTECENCGLWFRRIEEVGPIPHSASITEAIAPSEHYDDTVSDFRRVRLHFQIIRANENLERLETVEFKDAIGRNPTSNYPMSSYLTADSEIKSLAALQIHNNDYQRVPWQGDAVLLSILGGGKALKDVRIVVREL